MLELTFSPFPEIYTERLHLVKLITGHASDIFQLRSDREVMQYLDRPLAKTIEEVASLIGKINLALEQDDGITWGITQKGNPAIIGTIGFWRIDKENYRGEIGYMLHKNFQGKGLMQEAMDSVINYGFTVMKLHSIEANVNPANSKSIRLLEKNQFIQEAYFKENYFYEGRFLDSAIYSRLNNQ